MCVRRAGLSRENVRGTGRLLAAVLYETATMPKGVRCTIRCSVLGHAKRARLLGNGCVRGDIHAAPIINQQIFGIMNEKEMIILCDGSTRYAEVDVTELKDGRWRGTWNGHNLTFHGGTWME